MSDVCETSLIFRNLFSDVKFLTENFCSILIFTEYFIHQMAFDNPNVCLHKNYIWKRSN